MKYFSAASLLLGLVAAVPATAEKMIAMPKMDDMLNMYTPCLINCQRSLQTCVSQSGPIAETCAQNFAKCLLTCQDNIFSTMGMDRCANACTSIAIDDGAEGKDMNMVQSDLKSCLKQRCSRSMN
ncbi:hypothetical protein N7532_004421 [Penicillium argentinense]|uniref:Uncharacterized protein n=1 Tax=Penicillium argentinense TaxID=1131581 RepID=A0A9W9KG41_9EURO|nr:uncharacterized protein N7532_004421 [Penicillium argentinense]KAJ5103892.1 hypothetical protein N7532_004421 [Penicillium argentinense]